MATDGSLPLPKDARIVELRAGLLTLETRECLLPGTRLGFDLRMEERPLPLEVDVGECLVMLKDRRGYLYHARIFLSQLAEADRQIIQLFINKGRGAPTLAPRGPGRSAP